MFARTIPACGRRPLAALLFAVVALSGAAHGAELAQNGSFETNGGSGSSTFANWSVVRENLDGAIVGNFYANFSLQSPLFKLTVPAVPNGTFAAMSDQSGPGRTAIYQDIAVPATGPAWLNLRLFVLNQANDFISPDSLELTVDGNQQVRVDVLSASATTWDVGAGVLTNVYRSQPGDAPANGYVPLSINLQPFAGNTVRVRIAEVDKQHGMVVGVDAVSATHVPTATCAPVRPREGGASCNLDLDGDGLLTATDALIATRYLLGFRNAALTQGIAFGACATTTSASALNISASLLAGGSPPAVDIDGDGAALGTTDGLLLVRAMLGLTGSAATSGAVTPAPGASRSTWVAARGYLNSACLAGVL